MTVETIESLRTKKYIEGDFVTFSGDPQDFHQWCSLVLERSRKKSVGIICSYSKVSGELKLPVKYLKCTQNNITYLCIPDVRFLRCEKNLLTSLYLPNVKYLNCKKNQIKHIYAPVATHVICSDNPIKDLDLPEVIKLECDRTDVKKIIAPKLESLQAGRAPLAELVVDQSFRLCVSYSNIEMLYLPNVIRLNIHECNKLKYLELPACEELVCSEYCLANELEEIYAPNLNYLSCDRTINKYCDPIRIPLNSDLKIFVRGIRLAPHEQEELFGLLSKQLKSARNV